MTIKILVSAGLVLLMMVIMGMMLPQEWRISKLADSIAENITLIVLSALFIVPVVGILIGGALTIINIWSGTE